MKSPDSEGRPDPARVEELFHAAGQLPAAEQTDFLKRECGEDRATEQAVCALLAASQEAPAWASTTRIWR